MIEIRTATADDVTDISVLLVSVFRQRNEAQLVKALRSEGSVAAELVAADAQGLVGHVCLSRLMAPQKWLALAPVSVRNEQQGQGIGADLVRHALDAARRAQADAVVVVGDPRYYGRFGFVFDGPSQLTSPYPQQYMGLYPISAGSAMARAALVYPEAFDTV